MNFTKIASIGCLLVLATSHSHAQILAAWTFDNDAVANNNSPATSSGTGTAGSIGMTNTYPETSGLGNSVTVDDVNTGKSSDTGANGIADTTSTWRIRGAGAAPNNGNGWNSAAPIGTQGAQFFAPTTSATSGANAIKLTFDWYATTQGEANLQLEYTTNGGTSWTNAPITIGVNSTLGLTSLTNSTSANTVTGAYISDNLLNNGSKAGQDWFTGLTATITDSNALNDAGFGFEMVDASIGADDVSTQGTALNNNSGNWRFDNITISAAAVPEPSSWALALGALGLGIFLRRRSLNHKTNEA